MKNHTYTTRAGFKLEELKGVKAEIQALPDPVHMAVLTVYQLLKDRTAHASGEFDKAGRWYPTHSDLVGGRSPSRAWPLSLNKAARTKKYVLRVAVKFDCKTVDQLLDAI